MSFNLTKKAILKKTAQFGTLTFFSRIFGIIREMLVARILGVGAISDAFLTALKIPSFLRRIFAEGSLSAAFIPVFVRKVREKDEKQANGLMTLSFLFFEGIVLIMIALVAIYPRQVLYFAAPGFSQEQLKYAIPFLRILFPMIFFFSGSALLAGALNSVNHVFIPAFGPVVNNIIFIAFLFGALYFKFSVSTVCFGVLLSSLIVFLMHLYVYFKYNFKFGVITDKSYAALKSVLSKFIPSLLGVSIIEINLFIDTAIASFLNAGSLSMLHYAGRFMNMPIGIFAVSFATILLPHFSRCASYAPKRLNFHILETTKIITWLLLPATIFLIFVSEEIFTILMFGNVTSLENALIAKWLLILYSVGIVFYALNKILVNVFYAMHDTVSPTIALVIATFINFGLNVVGMIYFGVFGIAASTTISGIALTLFYFYFLYRKYRFKFYFANYFNFLIKYGLQISSVFIFSSILYKTFFYLLKYTKYYDFFRNAQGFWIITMSIALAAFVILYKTKKLFGIKIYYLSK